MKTIILLPRCAVHGMSDELLKWLFAVNVLKTSIAAEQLMLQRQVASAAAMIVRGFFCFFQCH